MAKAKDPVLMITYTKEKDMRKDIAKKMADGYTVQSTNITEHRGKKGCLFLFASLLMSKKKHYHVTYILTPPAPPPMPTQPPTTGTL